MRRFLTLLLVFSSSLVFLTLVSMNETHAVKHRRPFQGSYRVTANYDNDGNPNNGRCTDYECRGRCYNSHTGTDYGLPFNTAIRASASGTVVSRNDGCENVGSLGNTCGGRCGNYIQLRHDDGTQTIYCHMKKGGLAVSNGQRVNCGQIIGYSASSGSSTGNHLHFGWKPSGSSREPYAGQCGKSGASAWVQQNAYSSLPSEQCEVVCQCNPGQTDRRSCGRCGRQERRCGGNCRWGSWSSCTGQGACTAGAKESKPCCDCGTSTRTCSNACSWNEWSDCAGPDPTPLQTCETGKPGVCAQGAIRCEQGCLQCVEEIASSQEVCDGLDNDCNGEVDDQTPKTFGDSPPAYAAKILEYSLPSTFEQGTEIDAWIRVQNVGTSTWDAEGVVLKALSEDPHAALSLRTPSWLAFDTPARLEQPVSPQEDAVLTFTLAGLQDNTFEGHSVRFVLSSLAAGPMMCPAPDIMLDIASLQLSVRKTPEQNTSSSTNENDQTPPEETLAQDDGCQCASSSSPLPAPLWLLGVLLVTMRARRRRAMF